MQRTTFTDTTARIWQHMRLEYVGTVGELVRATEVGSVRDTGNAPCVATKRRTGTGTAC